MWRASSKADQNKGKFQRLYTAVLPAKLRGGMGAACVALQHAVLAWMALQFYSLNGHSKAPAIAHT